MPGAALTLPPKGRHEGSLLVMFPLGQSVQSVTADGYRPDFTPDLNENRVCLTHDMKPSVAP